MLASAVLLAGLAYPVSGAWSQAVRAREARFSEYCRPGARLELDFAREPRYPAAIVSATIGPDRSIVLTGARPARVVVLDSTGAILRSLGRDGDGPGEFRLPSHAVTTSNGGLAVVDPVHQSVTMFDSRGRTVSVFATPRQSGRRLAVLADGGFAIAGFHGHGQSGRLVGFYGARGEFRLAAVPIPREALDLTTPAIDDAFIAALGGQRVVVGSSVAPRLWIVDPATGAREVDLRLDRRVWRQLTPLHSAARTPEEVRSWVDAATLIRGFGLLTDRVLALGLRTGGAGEERSDVVLVPTSGTSAVVLSGAPGTLRAATTGWLLLQLPATDAANLLQWYTCVVPAVEE